MSLPASLVDTPMYDGTGKLSFAWIQKFGDIGKTAPVQALLYGSSAQRKAADKATLPDGVLWLERDTGLLYRLEYLNSGAGWIALDYVQGAANLTDPGRLVMVGPDGEVTETPFASTDVVLGAPNLTHAGQVPKVSAAGTLSESALNDDGANFTVTGRKVGIDTATPSASLQIVNTGNPAADFLKFSYNAAGIADFTFSRAFFTGTLSLQGTQVGNNNIALAPSSGNVGIRNASPGFALDVGGDVNTSTGYRKGTLVGLNITITLAKLTPTTGTNGSITVSGGIITGYVAPT